MIAHHGPQCALIVIEQGYATLAAVMATLYVETFYLVYLSCENIRRCLSYTWQERLILNRAAEDSNIFNIY